MVVFRKHQQQTRASLMALYKSLSADREHILKQSSDHKPVARPIRRSPVAQPVAVGQQIDDIERERKKLENRDFAQNTELKRRALNLLFTFLAIESVVIFGFAFAQGTHWPAHFHIEEWSFKLLVSATIAQITGMLFVAIRYLFPKTAG